MRIASRELEIKIYLLYTGMELSTSDYTIYSTLSKSFLSLQAEMGWRSQKVEVLPWLDQYAARRYGNWTPEVHEAWRLLISGAYSYNRDSGYYYHSFVVRRPSSSLTPDTRFRPGDIFQAWKLLSTEVLSRKLDGTVEPLLYDLVDFGRQVLVNLFADVYIVHRTALSQFISTRSTARVSELNILSTVMLSIVDDVDALLSTNTNFLFGHWLSEARQSAASGTPDSVLNLIEFNARNQITRWGPNGNIEDYAAKEWAGLVSSYYKERWEIYTTWVANATEKGLIPDERHLTESTNTFEVGWNYKTDSYPITTTGDTLELTSKYLQKYTRSQDYINSAYTIMYNTAFTSDNLLYGVPVPSWTDSYEQFVWLCELHPDCAGFSYPPLAFKSKSSSSVDPFQFKSGSILFLKKG